MRKTLAYFASIIFLFYAGLSILHPSYAALAAWMGPLLGGHVYTFFTVFTLLVMDPLGNAAVGLVWLLAGLLIGVISGKKLGGSITAFMTWFTMIPLMFASVFGMYLNVVDSGITEAQGDELFEFIPVLPDQLSIKSFLDIPIFSDLAAQAMEMVSFGDASEGPMVLVTDLATRYMTPILLKPVIIITGAIIGAVLSGGIPGVVGLRLPTRKTAASTLVMMTILSQGIAAPLANGVNYDDGLYLEVIGGYIESEGRAITGQVLLGSEVVLVSPAASAVEDLMASFVVTQKIFDPGLLYSLPIPNIEHLVPMIGVMPNTFAVTVYAELDQDIVEARSEQVISEYESLYGIELSKVLSNPMIPDENDTRSMPPLTVTVYYSLNTFEETAENIGSGFADLGGFADTFQERLNGENKDIELYVAGMIAPVYFQTMLPVDEPPPGFEASFDAVFGQTFSVLAGIQITKDGTTSSGDALDMGELLGIGTPSYAVESDISAIIVSRDNHTGTTGGFDPDTRMKLSLPSDSPELMLLSLVMPMFGVMDIGSGPPSASDMRIDAPGIKLPEVSLVKTVQHDGDSSSYTVTATNNGATVIENVEVRDSFATKYGVLESGTNVASWGRIEPGESVSIIYTTIFSNPGVYTELPALMTWDGEVMLSVAASNILETRSKAPNASSMLANTYGVIKEIGDLVLDGKGNMLDTVLIGFILLIAIIDVFRYVRGRSKPEPEAPEEPSAPEPPVFGDIPGDPL